MFSGFISSISGMLGAGRRMDVTAHNIANSQTPDFNPLRTDSSGNIEPIPAVSSETDSLRSALQPFQSAGLPVSSNVDLSVEMTNLLINQRSFEANAAAFKMQDETLGELFDRSE